MSALARRLRRHTSLVAAAALAVLVAAAPASAQEDTVLVVPVRTAADGATSRVVFHWPVMAGYKVRQTKNGLAVTFGQAARFDLSQMGKVPGVTKLTPHKPEGRAVTVMIDTPQGATFSDFRADRKIAIDITAPPPSAKKEPAPKQAAAPAPKAATPPAPPPADPPPEAEAKAPAPSPSAEPPPATLGAPPAVADAIDTAAAEKEAAALKAAQDALPKSAHILTDVPPPAPGGDVASAAVAEDDTLITISTLMPNKLAAFTYADALWVVLDGSTGNTTPVVTGPQTAALGTGTPVVTDKGTALRYPLPQGRSISATKETLGWVIRVAQKPAMTGVTQGSLQPDTDAARRPRLIATLPSSGNLITLTDPATGTRILAVPSGQSAARITTPYVNPDLTVLPAAQGFAFIPHSDALTVSRSGETTTIESPNGLNVTSQAGSLPDLSAYQTARTATPTLQGPRLFDFQAWRQGGPSRLLENRRRIESMARESMDDSERATIFLRMALLLFANDFPHEALGAMKVAAVYDDSLTRNPSFVALRGAASIRAGRYEEGLRDLDSTALAGNTEADLWKGYAASMNGYWRRADRLFPQSSAILSDYPEEIAVPMAIQMAESALRVGDTARAGELLDSIDGFSSNLTYRYQAAMRYLQGESARQQRQPDEAIAIWKRIAGNRDQMYHTKGTLALIMTQLQQQQISLKDAIDRLDSLRFAWRGDGLEVQVLHALGKLKILNNQYLDGLKDLKYATSLAKGNLEDTDPITADMAAAYRDLFVNGKANSIPRLEAIAVFDTYRDFLPSGVDGEIALNNFITYLTEMDLLDRAADLLETQISTMEASNDKSRFGARLASLYLLDGKPRQALTALERTGNPALPDELTLERELIRARSFAQSNAMDSAINTLGPFIATSRDAQRLLADIEWRRRNWQGAGDATSRLLPPAGEGSLTQDEAQLVLNAAVAYRLAENAPALADLKSKYGSQMAATTASRTFNIVTREAGASSLADRDTILRIASEVDMFKGFLDSYKSTGTPTGSTNPDQAAPSNTPAAGAQ